MSDSYLQSLVTNKCNALGVDAAAEFFSVSPGLVRQWLAGSKTPSLAAVELVFQSPSVSGITTADAQWAGKDVFLAVPSYKSMDPRTVYSILGLWDRSKFGANVRYGDAFIVHSRTQLAKDFLNTGLKEILWIDDDMILPMGNAAWFNLQTGLNLPEKFAGLHAPTRLRSHGKTYVGGLYFGRSPRGRAIYYEAMLGNAAGAAEDKYAHQAPLDELRPVSWCGTGCLWHTRQVLEDIQKTFPHLAPEHQEPWHFFSNSEDKVVQSFGEIQAKVTSASAALKQGNGAEAERVLDDAMKQMVAAKEHTARYSQKHQGEDQTFGWRAKFSGHQPYVDLGLVCGHVGTAVYGPHNTGQQ